MVYGVLDSRVFLQCSCGVNKEVSVGLDKAS